MLSLRSHPRMTWSIVGTRPCYVINISPSITVNNDVGRRLLGYLEKILERVGRGVRSYQIFCLYVLSLMITQLCLDAQDCQPHLMARCEVLLVGNLSSWRKRGTATAAADRMAVKGRASKHQRSRWWPRNDDGQYCTALQSTGSPAPSTHLHAVFGIEWIWMGLGATRS